MANVISEELGFPILLVDPPMATVQGHEVPDVNLRALQEAVLRMLVAKPARLTGAEVRFMRQPVGLEYDRRLGGKMPSGSVADA